MVDNFFERKKTNNYDIMITDANMEGTFLFGQN